VELVGVALSIVQRRRGWRRWTSSRWVPPVSQIPNRYLGWAFGRLDDGLRWWAVAAGLKFGGLPLYFFLLFLLFFFSIFSIVFLIWISIIL
jgi:hypothetical protein